MLLSVLTYLALALYFARRFARVIYKLEPIPNSEDLWFASFFGLLIGAIWPATLALYFVSRGVRRASFSKDVIDGAKRR